MLQIATRADILAVEREMPWDARVAARSIYEQLTETATRHPDRPALAFQLKSGPRDKVVRLTWAEMRREVTRAANLFRRLGIAETDVVAFVLPNAPETPVVLMAAATAGIVMPINPLLSIEHIGQILRESGARVVVTLKAFPKTDLLSRVAEAVALAPNVETVLEVDLAPTLGAPLAWIVPLIRPRTRVGHKARILDFRREMAREPGEALRFAETLDNRVCAHFHTGGTTGLPKIAQHRARGILYNGWCGHSYIFTEHDVLLCPLPLFHVFAAYPILFSCLLSGAQIVLPTPQGYRGEGVLDNFWTIVARHRATFLITVPTAVAALMQRKVNADVSSLRVAISGSAPMPVELFNRFESATGVKLLEGYGLTEATCLVAINPPQGERKVGSVGLPFPYTDVRILQCDVDGAVTQVCGLDEIGEICVRNPGVNAAVYVDPSRNHGMVTPDGYLRTGDLGRLDADGYVWITGRAKDLIIRGGHNIDPGQIEEAMMSHPAVAFAGAIGQPDAHSGELPAVYVELCRGAEVEAGALLAHARSHIGEPAAVPKYVEILPELPKTAVGKILKPELRRLAITRIYDAALAGTGAEVVAVEEDRRLGLVAIVAARAPSCDAAEVARRLGAYTVPWRWSDDPAIP